MKDVKYWTVLFLTVLGLYLDHSSKFKIMENINFTSIALVAVAIMQTWQYITLRNRIKIAVTQLANQIIKARTFPDGPNKEAEIESLLGSMVDLVASVSEEKLTATERRAWIDNFRKTGKVVIV